jgi:catechol O-methyltransferase
MPREARLYSVEFNTANAMIARRILAPCWRARQSDRPGRDPWRRRRNDPHFEARVQLPPGSLDLVFLDHDKNAHLSDLELILAERWLHPGSLVVADNILGCRISVSDQRCGAGV